MGGVLVGGAVWWWGAPDTLPLTARGALRGPTTLAEGACCKPGTGAHETGCTDV
jgi:hypothetical protein